MVQNRRKLGKKGMQEEGRGGVKKKRLIRFLPPGGVGPSKKQSFQVACQLTHCELLCAVSCFIFEGSSHTQKYILHNGPKAMSQ